MRQCALKVRSYEGSSWFKKLRFFLSHVWFEKDLSTESKNQLSEKRVLRMQVNLQVKIFLKLYYVQKLWGKDWKVSLAERGTPVCIMYSMAIPVLEFSSEGYKIRKIFWQKSTVVKWNYWILWIRVVASC